MRASSSASRRFSLFAFLYSDPVPVRALTMRFNARIRVPRVPISVKRCPFSCNDTLKPSGAAAVVTVKAYDDRTKAEKELWPGRGGGGERVDQTRNHNLRTKYLWTVIS